MYHFPNEQLYHHNPYQQCLTHVEDTKLQNINNISETQYHQVLTDNVGSNAQLLKVETLIVQPTHSQVLLPRPEVIQNVKTKKTALKKLKRVAAQRDESKKPDKNASPKVDTSTFSIEERLVSAVWVHERKYTSSTISEVSFISFYLKCFKLCIILFDYYCSR